MKLNIGSSAPSKFHSKNEWINIDVCKDFKGKNFAVADGCKLPFKDNSFDEIQAIHILEHIERSKHKAFFNEIYRTLKLNGVIFIEVPDFIAICNYLSDIHNKKNHPNYQEQLRIWTLSVYGKGRYYGDTHRWGFYKELLQLELEAVGFKVDFPDKMISNHYWAEPVILVRGVK